MPDRRHRILRDIAHLRRDPRRVRYSSIDELLHLLVDPITRSDRNKTIRNELIFVES
jgi:hypothetical protein